jgi:hypothetical protein
MKIYAIYTKNRFNQVLLFTSKAKAINWLKTATTLTDYEHEIVEATSIPTCDYMSIFQKDK